MKKTITILALLFALISTSNLFAQSNLQDVIYLTNGAIYRGTIIEKNKDYISIKTGSGSYEIAANNVEKITRETAVIAKPVEQPKSIEQPKYYEQKTYTEQPNVSPSINSTPYRDPIVSTFMSLLIPGAGQIYNYEVGKVVGFILWGVASQSLMLYSLAVLPLNSNEEYQRDWTIVAGISAVSYLVCWIYSMTDANKTSKYLNEGGLYSMNLGNNKSLSISPDLSLVNDYSKPNTSSSQASYGMKIKLSF